jgi:hypothetical protein
MDEHQWFAFQDPYNLFTPLPGTHSAFVRPPQPPQEMEWRRFRASDRNPTTENPLFPQRGFTGVSGEQGVTDIEPTAPFKREQFLEVYVPKSRPNEPAQPYRLPPMTHGIQPADLALVNIYTGAERIPEDWGLVARWFLSIFSAL